MEYFYNAKSSKYHSTGKQHFSSILLHYILWGCFLPPLWSHRVVTSKRAHHEQQTMIDIGVQIVVVGGGQGGEEKGRGESCECCY